VDLGAHEQQSLVIEIKTFYLLYILPNNNDLCGKRRPEP
jgi:hypothetical protein